MDHLHIYEELESSIRSYCRSFPYEIVAARGSWLYTSDGKRFLDFTCMAGSTNYGHNNPQIHDALLEYLNAHGPVGTLDYHTRAKTAMLVALKTHILEPRGLDYKVLFTGPTGTNSVECALKIAKKLRPTGEICVFRNSFHGMTQGALSICGLARRRASLYVEHRRVETYDFPSRQPSGGATESVAKLIEDMASGIIQPAAVVLELIQSEGGIHVADRDLVRSLVKTCNDHEVVVIVDDIQAGSGRSGAFFSFEHFGFVPDVVCCAKSIGGIGQPLALVLLRPHVDVLESSDHAGTFRGNNFAFVTAARAFELWSSEAFLSTYEGSLKMFAAHFAQMARQSRHVEVRHIGLMAGVEFQSPALGKRARTLLLEHGVLAENCGEGGRVLKIFPPLNCEADDLQAGLDKVSLVIDALGPDGSSLD
jgi:diaminobutyrate-2-oxoglutarate transaminase